MFAHISENINIQGKGKISLKNCFLAICQKISTFQRKGRVSPIFQIISIFEIKDFFRSPQYQRFEGKDVFLRSF